MEPDTKALYDLFVPRPPKIRFSFVIPDGPNAGYAGGSWILWTHKEDTYVAERDLGRTWKTSLHSNVAWQHAVTKEHASAPDSILPRGVDRALWKFRPTRFVSGQRLALILGVTRAAMRPSIDTVPWGNPIEVEDRWDRVTCAGVYMTERGVDPHFPASIIGGPLPLASGRRVWLAKRTEQIQGEPEEGIVGRMVRPLTPETDGVPAPMLLLVGLRLG